MKREMEDTLAKKLEKFRAYSDSVKRRASIYSDIYRIDDKKTAKSLGALHKAPSPGKKLQKIGFIMLWVPEPTGVTCAIGAPMILAGRFLNKKYNSATITDVGQNTRDAFSSINDFKNSIL
jgi:hypothetical protein